MADGHGGYRRPSQPASISGPGKFSKRTDGGPAQSISTVPDQDYGDAKQQAMDQRTAPLAGTNPMPKAAPVQGGDQGAQTQMPQYTGGDFFGPSTRPGEPVTHGVDIGPGGGPEVLGLSAGGAQPASGQMTALLQQLSTTDTTGVLAQLYQAAKTQGA